MTGPSISLATSTISVASGPASTMLLSNMPGNTQVINLDKINSVWVSENQSVTPGYGYRIGPLGTCIWQADRAPCYACVDTGVTAPVLLTYGNSVSDLINPVDVGIAVATELLATGIPNVIVTKVLGSAVITPLTAAEFDVSSVSAITIDAFGTFLNVAYTYFFYDAANNLIDANYVNTGQARLASKGTKLSIFNLLPLGGGNLTVNVSGSNRAFTTRTDIRMYDSGTDQWSFANQAVVVNTDYALLHDTQGVVTQGTLYARVAMGSATVQGWFFATDISGLKFIFADSAEMLPQASAAQGIIKMLALPAGYTIGFHCTVAGTTALNVQLVPASF